MPSFTVDIFLQLFSGYCVIKVASIYDQEETTLQDDLNLLTGDLRRLWYDYDINMIVLRAQNKIPKAVVGKSLAERASRRADVERWALRIESPLSWATESENELETATLEDDQDDEKKYYENETETEPVLKPADKATVEDIELLFRSMPVFQEEDREQPEIFNKEEWEGILRGFDTLDQLQAKIRTVAFPLAQTAKYIIININDIPCSYSKWNRPSTTTAH